MPLVRARTVVLACCVIGSTVISAADVTVKSQPLSPQHNVDGLITDWETLTTVTEKVTVAAANDTDRIMLAIVTSDPEMKQRLLGAGLVIYLDVNGKKSERFGVRIPPAGGVGGHSGRGGMGPGAPPDTLDPEAPGAGGRGRLPAITYVEVIGPEEHELHIVDLLDRKGFAAARADNQGTLAIEVNIPLRVADGVPYAPAVSGMPKIIGLGLVTPDVPAEYRGGGGGGRVGGGGVGISGGRGGMQGGGGGMGRGEPGGMSPGGHVSQGKSLKIWTTVSMVR
jgi:hypothetical protein